MGMLSANKLPTAHADLPSQTLALAEQSLKSGTLVGN
jgi:hypothetical protein